MELFYNSNNLCTMRQTANERQLWGYIQLVQCTVGGVSLGGKLSGCWNNNGSSIQQQQ